VDEQATALGDATDAAAVGLSALSLSPGDRQRASLVARLRSLPRRDPVPLVVQEIHWDGKKLDVTVRRHELQAGETRVAL
jgi:hypothetical protein